MIISTLVLHFVVGHHCHLYRQLTPLVLHQSFLQRFSPEDLFNRLVSSCPARDVARDFDALSSSPSSSFDAWMARLTPVAARYTNY